MLLPSLEMKKVFKTMILSYLEKGVELEDYQQLIFKIRHSTFKNVAGHFPSKFKRFDVFAHFSFLPQRTQKNADCKNEDLIFGVNNYFPELRVDSRKTSGRQNVPLTQQNTLQTYIRACLNHKSEILSKYTKIFINL